MKILSLAPLEHAFAVECHSPEDLAFMSTQIHEGDLVSGETDRNIKPREPGQKPFRIKMFLTLRVHSVSADEGAHSLRVSGVIEGGSPPEFVEMHAQHALVFGLYAPIRVQKNKLYAHEIDRLRAHEIESKKPQYFGVVLDDEEASLHQVTPSGLKELGKISAMKSGKQYKSDFRESGESAYFSKIAEVIFASPLSAIIVAGPGFAREGLIRYLNDHKPRDSSQSFLSVATSDTGVKGIRQALSTDSISRALGESALAKEAALMAEVLKNLGKETGLATYGFSFVERAVKAGAAHTLLISAPFFAQNRTETNPLLELARQMGVPAHVLDAKFEPGKQLEGLGGIVALLRYRFE